MKKTFQLNHIFLLLIVAVLIIFPFVMDSRTLTILLTQIFIFSILSMSYDLLLGYTGIVSFGHAMFFGLGAYATAIILHRVEPTIGAFILSVIVGMGIAAVVSFFVGLLTLRLKSHFFAMLTMAVSGLFLVVAEKWRTLTHGNDGFTFKAPELFQDRTVYYLVVLACLIVVYLFLRRFVNSPLGKVLVAVRENEPRTKALGFKTIHYKVIASIVAGVFASLAGSLYAVSLRFVNTSVLTMDITLDALLMTIIGGVGTLIGPILGAGVIEFAQHYLSGLAKSFPIFERWIIFFGIIYILAVIFFPMGIVGSIRQALSKRKKNVPVKAETKKEAA